MPEEIEANRKIEGQTIETLEAPLPPSKRLIQWTQHGWRPAGTVVAVGLALLIGWHVVNGKHGLSVWQQMRSQDRELQQEIRDLQQENAAMSTQIDQLKSDPEAIERKAREELHYAKPGEVIYTLPEPAGQQPAAGK